MATLGTDVQFLAAYVDNDGASYTPDPPPTMTVLRLTNSFSTDVLAVNEPMQSTGVGGTFGYLLDASLNDEIGTLIGLPSTSDTNLDPLLREWSIYEDVTESASVDLSPVLSAIATVPAAVWDRATSLLTTPGSIGKFFVDRLPLLTTVGTRIVSFFDLTTNTIGPITRGDSYGGAAGGTIFIPNRYGDCDLTLATEIRISFLEKGRKNKAIFSVTKTGNGVAVISSSLCQPILTTSQTRLLQKGMYVHEATAFFSGSPQPQRTFSQGPVIVEDRDVIL